MSSCFTSFGHEVDYRIDAVTPELQRAVHHDFTALSAQEGRRLSYFSSPSGAFAEFFAERYDPIYSSEGVADLDRLARTRRVVNESWIGWNAVTFADLVQTGISR